MGDKMQEQKQRKLRLDKEGVPYAICPKCNKQIYNLEVVEQVYITYDVSPDERDELEYDEVDRETAWDWDYEYKCIECHETIATSEEEAEALFYEPEPEQDTAQEKSESPAHDNIG